ncbi:DUF4276 family protein [Amycolatopsis regifaucium]|uniref:DUF4276 domain-containing protein n=1 Tax=Amycolatopsis regifaucium TaxID=546365 RepID=A0A154MQ12_9PSEU|nr:DUF4276 family protein [Amycolatopsis regifaucium]KZB86408.1 hypothetical protein AVL48_26830 [Amycolatopsis regifaucium]OKA06546.1 hypothetical protein ATP06_0225120 [Amycolatopsis regifaucium]SFJ28871.1 protein of unknown function [Amycolatopsis regifaucium]
MPDQKRLHLLVEGQTEATVVRDVLSGHLQRQGWLVTYSTVRTQTSSKTYRGGVTSWPKLRRELKELLASAHLTVLTTLFDYYGFPTDAPGMATRPAGTATAKVEHVEKAMKTEIGDHRFVPHLVQHELESWVFAAGDQLAELRDDPTVAERITRDCAESGGPELVNDDPKNAPSKRLARYCPGYTKTLEGPLAIADLGIEGLRARCPHFADWLATLGSLA